MQNSNFPFLVWYQAMVHKLRKAMGNRDAGYTLEGMIEMAESIPLEDVVTGKTSNQVCYFKAKVLETHTSNQINTTMEESMDDKTIVFTDKSTSYVDIADYVELHITEKSSKDITKEILKWAHIFISNTKRNLLGNYHKIKGKYLQLYLNEFCL